MYYVTRRSHQMQKHMLGVTCRGAFSGNHILWKPHEANMSMKIVRRRFTPRTH
jgi:hypothetical protein